MGLEILFGYKTLFTNFTVNSFYFLMDTFNVCIQVGSQSENLLTNFTSKSFRFFMNTFNVPFQIWSLSKTLLTYFTLVIGHCWLVSIFYKKEIRALVTTNNFFLFFDYVLSLSVKSKFNKQLKQYFKLTLGSTFVLSNLIKLTLSLLTNNNN